LKIVNRRRRRLAWYGIGFLSVLAVLGLFRANDINSVRQLYDRLFNGDVIEEIAQNEPERGASILYSPSDDPSAPPSDESEDPEAEDISLGINDTMLDDGDTSGPTGSSAPITPDTSLGGPATPPSAPDPPDPPAPPAPGPSGPQSGDLLWSEEFNSFNSTFWNKEYSTYGDGNNELQCYTHDQVEVSSGKLILTAKEQVTECPGSDIRNVTSGMVRSKNVEFSPGMRVEWSVKLTPNDEVNQGGLWPAFWSSGWAGGGWPLGGEWDGFEVMTAVDPTRTVYSLHYSNPSGSHEKTSTPRYSANKFSDSWHTFRFDYGVDGTMVWYRDGYETKTVTSANTKQGWPAPFDQDMKEFKINLALGGNPGPLDTRALPATLEVGWIRIYKL